MARNYFLIILVLVLICLGFIAYTAFENKKSSDQDEDGEVKQEISYSPPPFQSYISGVGVVEASSDNIFIGTPINRIVEKVLVNVGQEVKKGDKLIVFENKDLESDLHSKEIDFEIAKAKLKKLEEMPRREDLINAESSLKKAQSDLEHARIQNEMVQSLRDPRAISLQEANKRKFALNEAQTSYDQAQANLEKIKSGTWKPDLEIAKLEVLQAKASVDRIKTEIGRTVIRSPIDGKILQIRIHEGEMPPPDTFRNPIMIVGNTTEKHLKVSINQFDAPYFKPKAVAIAFLRGHPQVQYPLEFVQLDPYLVNKENFTNDIKEKVDTRVLQVIYRFKQGTRGLFVGQQMDVFIEAQG